MLSDEQIKHMVSRFLNWRLPDNFNPDCGISFTRDYNTATPWPAKHEPVGTNLFDYNQAEAMVRHMLEGLPVCQKEAVPVGEQWRALEDGSPKTSWYYEKQGDRAGWEALAKRTPATYQIETRALYTSPAPAGEPVGIKALEMVEAITPSNFYYMRDVGDLNGWCERMRNTLRSALHPTPTPVSASVESEIIALLREVRTWIGDGENADDLGREIWTDAYADIIDRVDDVLTRFPRTELSNDSNVAVTDEMIEEGKQRLRAMRLAGDPNDHAIVVGVLAAVFGNSAALAAPSASAQGGTQP